MLRECSLEEISDGKRYTGEDLVKANCHDCIGCHDCCCQMGNSILLDPHDVYDITNGLHVTFEQLLNSEIELNLADGLILPNLRMQGTREACAFLNKEGRCGIHQIRPGFCRLFPLGRVYENGGFTYFLQNMECKSKNRSKIRVRNWLGYQNYKSYEKFVLQWHDYLQTVREYLAQSTEVERKQICMQILTQFYLLPYDETDFYEQFYQRLSQNPIHR